MKDFGFWQGIMEVVHGRGQLRLIVQPTIAVILGVRLGIFDAKHGKDPFAMRLFVTGRHRWQLAKESLHQVLVPFLIAVIMDGILQYVTLGYVRPLAAVIVAAVLIFIPFMAARAWTNRIYVHRHHQTPA